MGYKGRVFLIFAQSVDFPMSDKIQFITGADWSAIRRLPWYQEFQNNRPLLLVDENTRQHCLPRLLALAPDFSEAVILEVPSGEAHKNLETSGYLWEKLTEAGADRKSILVNLGGGVLTDLGGFVASVYKRGIRFVQIPTTLLAQVDASIGGKTGIDFLGFKNQLGLFSQAEHIIIDPGFLNTLPKDELRSGCAEVIKIHLLGENDYSFFYPEETQLESLIPCSVRMKLAITEADFTETGIRKALNAGHTIGHALETFYLNRGKALLHGDAVAAGLLTESWLACESGIMKPDVLDSIQLLITKHFPEIRYLSTEIPSLVSLMRQDKKNHAGKIRFSLVSEPGTFVIDQTIEETAIAAALLEYPNLYKNTLLPS